MANEPAPSRDTVHRFTLVRPVARYRDDSRAKRFVILEDSLTDAQTQALAKPDNSIVGYFKAGQTEKVRQGLAWLQGKGQWIASLADLFARYPDSGSVYAAFAHPKNTARAADLEQAIVAALTRFDARLGSISSYLKGDEDAYFSRKIALWDNMLVRYFNLTQTPEVREECLRLIRLFWIMERLLDHRLNDQDVADALAATVVLPQPTQAAASTPASPAPELPGNAADATRVEKETTARLQTLKAAAAEISRQRTIQLSQPPVARIAPVKVSPPPDVLHSEQVGALSEQTHGLLRELQIPKTNVHVPTALGLIQAQIKTIQMPPQPAPVPQLLKVGSGWLAGDSVSMMLPHGGAGTALVPRGGSAPAPADPFTPGASAPARLGKGFSIGMAPLYVVETRLLKYQQGEIAHIENVLAGESKKRKLRVLNRVEETVATDEESTVLTEKDSQTTDKYELSQEVSKTQKEDMKFDTGVKVNADLGSVQIAATADFSYANSKDSTDKTASTQAKEIINKAVNSISTRTRTQRTVTTINESEEINEHDLVNKSDTTNIAGIYRWLDKYYLAELKSYGTRKMLEFTIPEPAAFYLFALANRKSADPVVEKPTVPMVWAPGDPPETTDESGYRPIQTYADFKLPSEDPANNYMDRIKQSYGYILPPAPKDSVVSIQTIKSDAPAGGGSNQTTSITGATSVVIPTDYYCNSLGLTGSYDPSGKSPDTMLYVAIGDLALSMNDFSTNVQTYPIASWKGEGWVGAISVAYHLHVTEFVIELACWCYLTTEAKNNWRKAAFDAVMNEYNAKLKAYNQWLKSLADAASMSVTISGNNPNRNREIEREELKKSCIETLTGQRYESFDAMRYAPQVPPDKPFYGYPDFSFDDATDEGRIVRFFEGVFDWHLMTYEFFPYFWGNKSRWTLLKSLDDNDPIFRNFLQAGSARVQVPVRPNYEDTVDYFIQSRGEIWNGGEAPSPGDPLWLSVADDQKNATDDSAGTVIDQWIIKLPTDLVFLEDFGSQPPDNTQQLKPEMFQKIKNELGVV